MRRFWQASDLVLLVAAADAEAVMESYAAIKMLLAGATEATVSVAINGATGSEATDAHARIAGACRKFLGLALSEPLCLEADPAIKAATSAGRSFLWPTTGGASAEQLERWADAMWTRLRGSRPRSGRQAA